MLRVACDHLPRRGDCARLQHMEYLDGALSDSMASNSA